MCGGSFSDSPLVFTVVACCARFIQGVGAAGAYNVVFAIISAKYTTSQVRFAGVIALVDGLGFSFGPILTSGLYELLGFRFTNLAYTALLVLLGIVSTMFLPVSAIDSNM
jgi:MFS family permease